MGMCSPISPSKLSSVLLQARHPQQELHNKRVREDRKQLKLNYTKPTLSSPQAPVGKFKHIITDQIPSYRATEEIRADPGSESLNFKPTVCI